MYADNGFPVSRPPIPAVNIVLLRLSSPVFVRNRLSERCLLARKACLHGHHSRLLLHARLSQPYVRRVHASAECVQWHKGRVRARICRLLGYTGLRPLRIGVLRANKQRLWTNKHRWWAGMFSLHPVFVDSRAVWRGL